MITVFQCITMEGWTDVLYYVSYYTCRRFFWYHWFLLMTFDRQKIGVIRFRTSRLMHLLCIWLDIYLLGQWCIWCNVGARLDCCSGYIFCITHHYRIFLRNEPHSWCTFWWIFKGTTIKIQTMTSQWLHFTGHCDVITILAILTADK